MQRRIFPTQSEPSELCCVVYVSKGELFLGRQPGDAVGQVWGVYPHTPHDALASMNTHSFYEVCLTACLVACRGDI